MNHSKDPEGGRFSYLKELSSEVGKKEDRHLKGVKEKHEPVLFGLGMLGLVGWSIVTPTVLGIFLGVWIDRKFPSQYSFTLMLMFLGLVFGCLTAWRWIKEEIDKD